MSPGLGGDNPAQVPSLDKAHACGSVLVHPMCPKMRVWLRLTSCIACTPPFVIAAHVLPNTLAELMEDLLW